MKTNTIETGSELECLRRAAIAADDFATRCGEETMEAEAAAHKASRVATGAWNQFLAAYEAFHGEPWQAPEPRYREIPGLE